MSKDPAFLFYPNDWIGGTMGMTFEEKGAYMELLMMQFNRGHMTGHMVGQIVGSIWEKIQNKFKIDENGLYYNERLEEEQQKRKAFTDSRKNNILGINQHTKKEEKKGGHMTGHMENENNINIIKKRKEKFIEDLKPFLELYKKEMINSFYSYWSELNKSETKMRFELQKTWELKKRLVTWAKNENNFSKKEERN
jgi:hypothetical protein